MLAVDHVTHASQSGRRNRIERGPVSAVHDRRPEPPQQSDEPYEGTHVLTGPLTESEHRDLSPNARAHGSLLGQTHDRMPKSATRVVDKVDHPVLETAYCQ
jgi:hypothetical protein